MFSTDDAVITGSGLNVNAQEFIPRGTGTRHVWNVNAPSFVPSQPFTRLNVFAKEFVPGRCDFVKENRVDSPGSVSVDICVSKCNGSQMVRCNQWFQCSESPECGGPCRLGDRCRRAQCVFNFNSDYICSDDKCAVSCNTPQQYYIDFDSDKYHAWPQAN